MFRPTQTVPSILTAVHLVAGFALTIGLVVVAMLVSADTGLPEEFRDQATRNSGLLFLTAILTFVAALRPLAGGLVLAAMALLIIARLPIPAITALVFSLVALLRAYMSRRYLAGLREGRAEGEQEAGEPTEELADR